VITNLARNVGACAVLPSPPRQAQVSEVGRGFGYHPIDEAAM